MSYHTDFALDFQSPFVNEVHEEYDVLFSAIKSKLEEVSTYDWEGFELCNSTWYNWREDIKVVSESFPDILFTLWGNGEISEDIWVAYVKNGKIRVEFVCAIWSRQDSIA